MHYVKSILAGIGAVITVLVLTPFILFPLESYLRRDELREFESIGWDPVAMFRGSWIPWVVLCLAFALGFYWRFRRT